MTIYKVTTREQSSENGEFTESCLFDAERNIAIIMNFLREGDYVTKKGREIAKFIGLVKAPGYEQRDGSGWYIKDFEVKEVNMEPSVFDTLVKKLAPHLLTESF